MDRAPMTQQGYDQLSEQLTKLKNEDRPRVEKALGEAREHGDLSENSEYDAAREELWRIDRRIAELEDRLARAQVVDLSKVSRDEVAIGAIVKVEDIDKKFKDQFMIVGEGETRDGIDTVSVASPLGSALIGKKIGEVAEFQAPRGRLRYKVLEIRYT